MSDYQHDGAMTIKLSHDNDEITVWPSVEAPGSVTIALLDSEEPRTNVGIATPAEWDAFVAAGNAVLGRPAMPHLGSVAEAYNTSLPAGLCVLDAKLDELLRRTAAREQGATVPRAGVAAALAPVLTLHAQVAEECGEERTNAIELLLTALDEARATLAAAGLWSVPADGGAPCAG